MDYNQVIIEGSKILIGIFAGTMFTVWYRAIKDKKQDRKRLFLRMIVSKGYLNVPQHLIDDLNTIEIIFRGRKRVLEKYRAYYASLFLPEEQVDLNYQQGLYWDLLREMGNEVGYKNLDNKVLDSKYIPKVVWNEFLENKEFRKNLLEYLKNGNDLYSALLEFHRKSQPPDEPKDTTQ